MTDKTDWTIGKIIGLASAVLALAGLVLWGVPSYIQTEVRTRVAAELALTDFGAAKTASDLNTASVLAMQTQLTGMEQRMIQRDEFIMGYFRDQAERNPGCGVQEICEKKAPSRQR